MGSVEHRCWEQAAGKSVAAQPSVLVPDSCRLRGSFRDLSGPLSSCCGLWAALNSSFGRDRVARYHPMALRAEASLEQDAVWTDSCRHSPPRLHRAWPRGPDFQGLEHASA